MNVRNAALVAALGLSGLAGCDSRPAKPRLSEVDRVPRIETVQPELSTREVTVDLLATVEALERVRLCARVQAGTTGLRGMRGFIKTIPSEIDIGLPVKEGQPLLDLELPDLQADRVTKGAYLALAKDSLRQAEQAIDVAEAEIKEAEALVRRYEAEVEFKTLKQKRVAGLVKREALAVELVDEADLELRTAQAALQTARTQVTTRKARHEAALRAKDVAASKVLVAKSELDALETLAGFTKVTAPFPAIITRRWVSSGDTITDAAMPLLTVMRLDTVRVVMNVPERYVPRIRAAQGNSPQGAANRVKINIGPYKGEHEITRLAAAVNDVTRLMRAEVHVKNDERLLLRPGMTGTATVVLTEAKTERLTVPSTALVRVGEELRVYYLEDLSADDPPRGKVKSVPVRIGLDDGKTVEVLSGLKGNEAVIAKGNGVVREGETAIAVKARER
jgi:RND family efflux transporter MFP subunit